MNANVFTKAVFNLIGYLRIDNHISYDCGNP